MKFIEFIIFIISVSVVVLIASFFVFIVRLEIDNSNKIDKNYNELKVGDVYCVLKQSNPFREKDIIETVKMVEIKIGYDKNKYVKYEYTNGDFEGKQSSMGAREFIYAFEKEEKNEK